VRSVMGNNNIRFLIFIMFQTGNYHLEVLYSHELTVFFLVCLPFLGKFVFVSFFDLLLIT
jgi:hypothetical protein